MYVETRDKKQDLIVRESGNEDNRKDEGGRMKSK